MTRREIGYRALENKPWLRLSNMIFTDNKADNEFPIDEKLIIPADLAEVWQQATFNGQPFATYMGDIVEGAPMDNTKPWFTPIFAAILVLLITIVFAFTRYPYWDWMMLIGQMVYGIHLLFLWIIIVELGVNLLE